MRVENLFTVAWSHQPVTVFTVQGDCVPYVYLFEGNAKVCTVRSSERGGRMDVGTWPPTIGA